MVTSEVDFFSAFNIKSVAISHIAYELKSAVNRFSIPDCLRHARMWERRRHENNEREREKLEMTESKGKKKREESQREEASC